MHKAVFKKKLSVGHKCKKVRKGLSVKSTKVKFARVKARGKGKIKAKTKRV